MSLNISSDLVPQVVNNYNAYKMCIRDRFHPPITAQKRRSVFCCSICSTVCLSLIHI